MSSRYKVHDSLLPHFITSTVVGWVDALSREEYKEQVCKSLKHCIEKKGLLLNAWVIMSNHIHLIVQAEAGSNIGDIVRDFKKFTSKTLLRAISENPYESRKEWMLNMFGYAGSSNRNNKDFQFWQHDFHPISLDTPEKLQQRLNYLHQNPVRAGWVWEPQHYKYSSAMDYYENKTGLLPISKLVI